MQTCNETTIQNIVSKHAHPTTTRYESKQQLSPLERDSTELQLLKLLQQHRNTDGWILLVGPTIKPSKAFWAACQLPLDKILVIHQQQIKDISATLRRAMASQTCKVIINCLPLSETELTLLTDTAQQQQQQQQCRFYPLNSLLDTPH